MSQTQETHKPETARPFSGAERIKTLLCVGCLAFAALWAATTQSFGVLSLVVLAGLGIVGLALLFDIIARWGVGKALIEAVGAIAIGYGAYIRYAEAGANWFTIVLVLAALYFTACSIVGLRRLLRA